eukprot:10610_1
MSTTFAIILITIAMTLRPQQASGLVDEQAIGLVDAYMPPQPTIITRHANLRYWKGYETDIMGNINKTKDKENIIDFNHIIKIQQNKNDEQKELDIITKWKVNYIENPFFKPRRDDQEKPKYNFNYLQFKQYNIHIKHSIIKKHGNKSDKIYLPKHLKNKNYKRKQYKHQW